MARTSAESSAASLAAGSAKTAERLGALVKLRFGGDEPLYAQITDRLRGLITDGELQEGTTLPSERRLAALLDVSRITVQNSYNELRRVGLISSHGRRGSVVQSPRERITSPMNRLRGFTDEMRALGRTPSSKVVYSEVRQDRQIATIFNLPSNTKLLYLERVRYADGVPLSNEKAWYNLASVPALVDCDLSASMYGHLAAQGHPLGHCEQTIEAVLPSADDCTILEIDPLTPCMLIKRQSFSQTQTMLEYVEGTFRGDVYSYRLTLPV